MAMTAGVHCASVTATNETVRVTAFFRIASWGIPAAMIVYAFRSLEDHFGRAYDFPVLLGSASYAIYLFHPIALGLVDGLFVGVALSIFIGLLVHFAVERPLSALRRASAARSPTMTPTTLTVS
jgi:peptidoglycan/LPS O-acetylase OafA/YrhL